MNLEIPESWQGWLTVAAAVYLVWQVWKGWRMGVVRAFFRLIAWGGAVFVGWQAGGIASRTAAYILPQAQLAAGILAGSGVGLAFLIVMTVLPRLFFKKTSDNSGLAGQLVYGGGGAVLGLVFGLLVVWAVLFGVRALESMERGRELALDAAAKQAERGSGPNALRPNTSPTSPPSQSSPGWDLLPGGTLEIIEKWSQVSADPQALERLAEYPDVADLLQHPKIVALGRDEQIVAAAQRRDVIALLSSPRLWDLATDPEVARRVRAIDMRAALDHALQEPRKAQ